MQGLLFSRKRRNKRFYWALSTDANALVNGRSYKTFIRVCNISNQTAKLEHEVYVNYIFNTSIPT
jgi:hypothetical protein